MTAKYCSVLKLNSKINIFILGPVCLTTSLDLLNVYGCMYIYCWWEWFVKLTILRLLFLFWSMFSIIFILINQLVFFSFIITVMQFNLHECIIFLAATDVWPVPLHYNTGKQSFLSVAFLLSSCPLHNSIYVGFLSRRAMNKLDSKFIVYSPFKC